MFLQARSRLAALQILFAKGYNAIAAAEVKSKIGFDLDADALEALRVCRKSLLHCNYVTHYCVSAVAYGRSRVHGDAGLLHTE